MRRFLSVLALSSGLSGFAANAGDITPRAGWAMHETGKTYAQLVKDVRAAVKQNGMAVVTQAGPTKAAANRGVTIPGNRVIGVFNNDFAVRILETSTAAMIEAPVRLYVTEEKDGTGTLSYKMPCHVFAPYLDEGGETLEQLASDLDEKFAAIASVAIE